MAGERGFFDTDERLQILDLGHGVRVRVRPRTTALMMAARAEAHGSIVPPHNDTDAASERTAVLVPAGDENWIVTTAFPPLLVL